MAQEFPTLTRKEQLYYFMLYAALTVVYSWQQILHFNQTTVGDALLQPHLYWWVTKSLLSWQNPYYTDYIFYPQGANLAFGCGMIPDILLALPITLLFGANQAVNFSFIIGFLLSGYFAFLLCYDLTENKKASFVGGFIFAFAPYHVNHVPHQIILTNTQWIPLYILLFRRALLSDSKKWSVLAGLAMALIILTDQLQAMLSVSVTALIMVFVGGNLLLTAKNRTNPWLDMQAMAVKLAIMVGVSALVASVCLLPAVDFMLNSPAALKISPFDHGGANQFGADLLGLITPPSYNPLWGSLFKPVGNNYYFLGVLPLVLALVGAKKFLNRGVVKIILTLTVIALVLSLGITLKVNGQWEWAGKHFKLPYYYLSNVPPLSLIRTPYRFHLLTTLGMAILASFGALYFTQAKSRKWVAIFIPVLICALFIEYFPLTEQYKISGPVPKIYQEMAKDKESYSVLILPLSRWTSLVKNGSGSPSVLMYYQSAHGKKIFNGFSPRVSNKSLDFGDAILDQLKDVSAYDNYDIHVFGKRSATADELAMAKEQATKLIPYRDQFIRDNNIRYIVIHAPISQQGSLTRVLMETFLGRPMIHDPDEDIAYIKVGS